MTSIIDVIAGRKSLPLTFWVWYVGGSLLSFVIIYVMVGVAVLVQSPEPVIWGVYASVVGSAFVSYAIGTGVYLSARKRLPKDVWAWAALLVVIITAGRMTFSLLSNDWTEILETHEEIRRRFGQT
jgi:drug/metabolite transporter (DMT)-like permease